MPYKAASHIVEVKKKKVKVRKSDKKTRNSYNLEGDEAEEGPDDQSEYAILNQSTVVNENKVKIGEESYKIPSNIDGLTEPVTESAEPKNRGDEEMEKERVTFTSRDGGGSYNIEFPKKYELKEPEEAENQE
jgi:hypothetical protein